MIKVLIPLLLLVLLVASVSAVSYDNDSDLLILVGDVTFERISCDVSVVPGSLFLSDDLVKTSFMVFNDELFATAPFFSVDVINGSYSGDFFFSDGVVLPGGSKSFTVEYTPGFFTSGASFDGYITVSSLECLPVSVPLTVDIVNVHSFLSRPVFASLGLGMIFFFWFAVWAAILGYSLFNSCKDDRLGKTFGLFLLMIFIALLFTVLTFFVCGGFVS